MTQITVHQRGRIFEIVLPSDAVVVASPIDQPKVIQMTEHQAGALLKALQAFEFNLVKTVCISVDNL